MGKAMVLGVFALAGTLASPAFAADEWSGWRLGMTLSSDKLAGDFALQGLGSEATNTDRFGYGLFGGWALNKWFAVEVGLHSGDSFNASPFPAFTQTLSVVPDLANCGCVDRSPFFNVHNDVKSLEATAVASWWITPKFSLFGRLGMFGWKAETTYSFGDLDGGPKTTDQVDDTDFAPMGGIGLQTVLDEALLRVEYQYVDLKDLPIGTNFGQFDNTLSSLTFSVVWKL